MEHVLFWFMEHHHHVHEWYFDFYLDSFCLYHWGWSLFTLSDNIIIVDVEEVWIDLLLSWMKMVPTYMYHNHVVLVLEEVQI
jgi:hypothetical protein